VRVPIVIDFSQTGSGRYAFLGARLILTEFSIGVIGSLALGVFTLRRSHSLGGVALGVYLLCIGMNYMPLLVYAISLVRLDSARFEIAEEAADKRRMFRKYRRQSLLLLVPLAVPILAAASELHRNTSMEYQYSSPRQILVQRPTLPLLILYSHTRSLGLVLC
jgi:hypothetical protein